MRDVTVISMVSPTATRTGPAVIVAGVADWGFGFRVQGLGFMVQDGGVGFRVQGVGMRMTRIVANQRGNRTCRWP